MISLASRAADTAGVDRALVDFGHTGSVQWNVTPEPGTESLWLLVHHKRPWCSSMNERQIFKPMPMPFGLVD